MSERPIAMTFVLLNVLLFGVFFFAVASAGLALPSVALFLMTVGNCLLFAHLWSAP